MQKAEPTYAPRRLVLLTDQGAVERVLDFSCDPRRAKERLREEAQKHPGRTVAAEHLGPLGWVRWLVCRRDAA